jgi:hypothetical protein
VAKDTHKGQQTKRTGQTAMTTLNGQKKKMKNLTESPKYKTVLAPNAPWPKSEEPKKPYRQREVGMKNVMIAMENTSLDYFLKTHEELNNYKTASGNRTRDKLSGRFKSN